jgi:hypothetical protein
MRSVTRRIVRMHVAGCAAAAVMVIGFGLSARATGESMRFVGDLRQIAGNTLVGTVPLKEIISKPGAYGLGMVDGLSAELLVLDSEPMLGGFNGEAYEIVTPKEDLVAFGGFAVVRAWREFAIPTDIKSFADLERFVATEIGKTGRPLDQPTPFRIIAEVESLKWFIVGGMGDLKPTPRESFVGKIRRGTLENTSIEAFGFHSSAHRGIYTNPQSNMHTHFLTTGPSAPFIGHIDDSVALKTGAKLFLPE